MDAQGTLKHPSVGTLAGTGGHLRERRCGEAGALPCAIYLERHWEMMEASQLELLRTDELDIALRLSYLEHCSGGAAGAGSADDKEARRKEKKKQKDLKVGGQAPAFGFFPVAALCSELCKLLGP